jgi:hypothetical protein
MIQEGFHIPRNFHIHVDDKGIIKYGLVTRPVNHTLFPNFYDYAASGYVLDNESNYESMTRVIYKELGVVVSNSFLIQNFLLEWSPYLHAQDPRTERFSVGRLDLCEIKVFIASTNMDANNFVFLTAEETSAEQLKPDLAQLFANQKFMNQIYAKVLFVKCSPNKDRKDKVMEEKLHIRDQNQKQAIGPRSEKKAHTLITIARVLEALTQ